MWYIRTDYSFDGAIGRVVGPWLFALGSSRSVRSFRDFAPFFATRREDQRLFEASLGEVLSAAVQCLTKAFPCTRLVLPCLQTLVPELSATAGSIDVCR